VIQQKSGCHRRTYFAHSGSHADDARAVDSAGREDDTLDSRRRRAHEPRFDGCDLARNSDNREESVSSLLR